MQAEKKEGVGSIFSRAGGRTSPSEAILCNTSRTLAA